LVHFIVTWCILCSFWYIFAVLVCCTKKNLATLPTCSILISEHALNNYAYMVFWSQLRNSRPKITSCMRVLSCDQYRCSKNGFYIANLSKLF
jgi:hypothetical protein